MIKLKEYINKSYIIFTESLIKNINNNIEKINIADDIYEFLKKYMNKIKCNIHIYNFIGNFEMFKDDINELFKKFLNLIYNEEDNFFEILYDNQNEENNNYTASEDEEFNEKYSEKELRLKLDGQHLYTEKNSNNFKDDEEIFEDEKVNRLKKYKSKKNLLKIKLLNCLIIKQLKICIYYLCLIMII